MIKEKRSESSLIKYKKKLLITVFSLIILSACAERSPDDHSNQSEKMASGPDPVTILSVNPGESDYPSICAGHDETAWIVWQAYHKGTDKLYVCHWENGDWHYPVAVHSVKGDIYKPACGVDGEGRLWIRTGVASSR
ncbi:MAG: hypothetical protein JXB23_06755 [Candidatus Aminicenantes bacterium]|nr:hypothetical protein [Candidatus Aminicenantes bacterium]